MKLRLFVYSSLLVVVAALAGFIPGRAQEASQSTQDVTTNNGQTATKNWAGGNPLKIALLKWYQANLVPTYFNVGKTQNSNPYGLAFDGSNVWSANSEGTVTKLRASDGAVLDNFDVGGVPTGIAFDGAN